jgi:hypothetical protein
MKTTANTGAVSLQSGGNVFFAEKNQQRGPVALKECHERQF